MSEKNIRTKTVSRHVAKADPIKLSETANTKVGFIPTLHSGGVRGQLVKYKKTSAKTWDELSNGDFESHALSSMQKVSIQLDTEATTKLIDGLRACCGIVDQGIQDGEKDYVVAEKGKALVIDDENKLSVLKQILNGGHSDEYWNLITKSQPDLATRLAAGHMQQIRKDTIDELKRRLTKTYPETTGPNSWQRWIFDHNWLFGVNYQPPIEKQKINLQGIMPDYLFPRLDGFVDLLEIKLPSDEVLVADSSHPGSFRWNAETAKAIGQVVTYLSEIERQQFEIEHHIAHKQNRRVSMLKPRAYILIGNSKDWPQPKLDGLRKLNDHLHGIEVLTYNELIDRGEAFLGNSLVDPIHSHEDDFPF